MQVAEIAAAIRKLPLSHTNLIALIASVECYAGELKAEGGLTGMESVCEALADATGATDGVWAITAQQRSEWARQAA